MAVMTREIIIPRSLFIWGFDVFLVGDVDVPPLP